MKYLYLLVTGSYPVNLPPPQMEGEGDFPLSVKKIKLSAIRTILRGGDYIIFTQKD